MTKYESDVTPAVLAVIKRTADPRLRTIGATAHNARKET
jgi:hypothetical protein